MKIPLLVLAALLAAPAVARSQPPAVTIDNDAFSPHTLTVKAGQSVTFTNDDDEAHTVTASDGSFDSKGLDTHGVWRHVFARTGTYAYFCELHPFMRGTIVVVGASKGAEQ